MSFFGKWFARRKKQLQQFEEDDDEHQRRIRDMDDDDDTAAAWYMQNMHEGSSRRRSSVDAIPKKICQRDHGAYDRKIRRDYFDENPVYNAKQFRRRFRMRKVVFERILHDVEAYDPYFQQRRDATGKLGLSALQKVTASVQLLATGVAGDFLDDNGIAETTSREPLMHFCHAIITLYSETYLREPTTQDTARLLQINARRGFPGMLGSIDCMHWEWDKCPTAWKGMFTGRGKHPSMILEAVASQDLWIWHAYFGLPGACNDINVLQRSPVFQSYIEGNRPELQFTVNGNTYNMGYFLADGIYPNWPAFVKTVRHPYDEKSQYFAMKQEAARKDIERAFGVLHARWGIVRGPAHGWDRDNLNNIMITCILLHNMIIEDERQFRGLSMDTNFTSLTGEPEVYADPSQGSVSERLGLVKSLHMLRDKDTCLRLQHDLIEHNWNMRNNE